MYMKNSTENKMRWEFSRIFESVNKTKIAPVTTLFVQEGDLEYFHVDNAAPEQDKFKIGDEASLNEKKEKVD